MLNKNDLPYLHNSVLIQLSTMIISKLCILLNLQSRIHTEFLSGEVVVVSK